MFLFKFQVEHLKPHLNEIITRYVCRKRYLDCEVPKTSLKFAVTFCSFIYNFSVSPKYSSNFRVLTEGPDLPGHSSLVVTVNH